MLTDGNKTNFLFHFKLAVTLIKGTMISDLQENYTKRLSKWTFYTNGYIEFPIKKNNLKNLFQER